MMIGMTSIIDCWKCPTIKDAYRLSLASLGITFTGAVCGFALYSQRDGSSLCLVYGLQCLVDYMSSSIILWRFFAPFTLTDEQCQTLGRRELRASVAISLLIFLLGMVTTMIATADMAQGMEDQGDMSAVAGVSFVTALVFGIMACIKFRYSACLESEAMYKDGVCSLIGAVLAIALFVDTLIIQQRPNAWWLDPTVAFLAGITSVAYGTQTVVQARYRDNIPICDLGWWAMSRGMDDENGVDVTKPDRSTNSIDCENVIDLTEYDEDVDEIYM